MNSLKRTFDLAHVKVVVFVLSWNFFFKVNQHTVLIKTLSFNKQPPLQKVLKSNTKIFFDDDCCLFLYINLNKGLSTGLDRNFEK